MREIKKIISLFKNGKIIIFPTDTVYGIGCILNDKTIQQLYKIKKRSKNKPTLILAASFNQAKKYAYFNPKAKRIAKKFWPAPLTLILKAKENVPKMIQGRGGTIAIRVPKQKLLQKILSNLKEPILAPSANFSGKKTPTTSSEIDKNLIKLVDYVVTEKNSGTKPSTIIDISGKKLKLIRLGQIKIQDFKLKGDPQ